MDPIVTTAPAQDPSLKNLPDDIVAAITLGQALQQAIKTQGFAPGVASLAPRLIATAEKDFADVKLALPAIKAGWKTSEFWAMVSIPVVNALYFLFTKTALPIDLNIVYTTVVGIYTVVRGMTKTTAHTAAAQVATAATAK